MRTLAIDLGTKRVGLALSDEGGRWATPLEVLVVSDPALAIDPVVRCVAKEGVERLVVGLPLNMDDSIGPAAKSVLAWVQRLRERVAVPILFVDERLSSFEAEHQLVRAKRAGAKLTRRGKKQSLDAVAAAHFLQAFLDGGLRAIDLGPGSEAAER